MKLKYEQKLERVMTQARLMVLKKPTKHRITRHFKLVQLMDRYESMEYYASNRRVS